MSGRVEELLGQIRQLTVEEQYELNAALHPDLYADDEWDRQMKADAAAGKWDKWLAEVDRDIADGKTLPFP